MKALEFLYKDTCGISENDLKREFNKLIPVIENFKKKLENTDYPTKESFIRLPFDNSILKSIEDVSKKINTSKVKYIFHIGIGGSNLGAKAVYDSLYGSFDVLEHERFPKIVFLDLINENLLNKVKEFLKKVNSFDEVLFIVVSESGTTKETIFNYSVLVQTFPLIKDRSIFITERGKEFEEYALSLKAPLLTMPIGGRFCLFSQSNLTSLYFCGVDILSLIKGAFDITPKILSENVEENNCASLAIATFLNSQKRINIVNNFYFEPNLETVGKWVRQLVAESIGKNGKGLTPIVSIGSTDLHSMYQLYAGGPRDKFTNFVKYKKSESVNKSNSETPVLNILKEKNAVQMENAMFSGVVDSYKDLKLPFTTTILEVQNTYCLGAYLQAKMVETAFLTSLLGVDGFNQPDVEKYKKIADEYLLKL